MAKRIDNSAAPYWMMITFEIEPKDDAEFNDIYDNDHIPTIMQLPGVLEVIRFRDAHENERGYLVYSALYVEKGWLGRHLVPLGITGAYSFLGIVLVLIFVSLPFAVRVVQPVIESLDRDSEEAARILGASRTQTFLLVVLPAIGDWFTG